MLIPATHSQYVSTTLTPLDLIVAKTSRYLAIRTNDRRIAGDLGVIRSKDHL